MEENEKMENVGMDGVVDKDGEMENKEKEKKMENNSVIGVVLKVGKLLPELWRKTDLKVYKSDDGIFVQKSIIEELLKPLNNFVDSAMMDFGYGPRVDGYKIVNFDKEWNRLEENVQKKSWVDGIVG